MLVNPNQSGAAPTRRKLTEPTDRELLDEQKVLEARAWFEERQWRQRYQASSIDPNWDPIW